MMLSSVTLIRSASQSIYHFLTCHSRAGTYTGSSSWFDACILRPLDPSTPRLPLAPDVAARIEAMMQRTGTPASSTSAETFPPFLVGNLLSHDPEDTRDFLRSLGWDFVERVERVEVDGEVGERRGVLWKVQTNMVACREYWVHEGQWWRSGEAVDNEGLNEDRDEGMEVGCGDGAGFVDQLQAGDQVGIWARAMVSDFFLLFFGAFSASAGCRSRIFAEMGFRADRLIVPWLGE